jgi:hypothetical protein
MKQDLTLHVTLQSPPAGVNFGLQKGSGNRYETVQIQSSDGSDLYFTLTIVANINTEKSSEINLSGPFVQGPPAARFIYFDIGALAGQVGGWSRRLKIPLTGITPNMVITAPGNPLAQLQTTVPGTAKDGGPNCATVKPFAGWKVKDITRS